MNSPLRRLVLRQPGFESPPRVNFDGLRAVYSAWCANVPFDNVRRMIALRSRPDDPLQGADADPFFEAWCMRDLGIVNHASVKVRSMAGAGWLIRQRCPTCHCR